ncbi:unnamed protein product [Acanthoscelides obtectus]|uniref:Uncharacterized protein n=1 Tax=Acanthoscelides obtectus TaxID=200917 RepID=A0A9P0L9S1_ACAOB|nr:unnamed protein product [Acanthoscelides obtectus]CAK1621799.1 hypothetical protein AOBTE_LOCUS1135 [Acanthoscelides obtectus]
MIVEANDSQIYIYIEESTDQTIHSSPEHPIIGIPITDTPINYVIEKDEEVALAFILNLCIRTEHMNSEEKDAIKKLVREYSDIFHIDGNKAVGFLKGLGSLKTVRVIPKKFKQELLHVRDRIFKVSLVPSYSAIAWIKAKSRMQI